MANPRRRSRTLRNFGAGGWPVGLPETIFRSFCDNLPCARFRRFGAREWPDELSERSFRATQSGGILDAAAAYAARSLCRNTGGPDYQGRGPGQWPQWPFYQPEADKWPFHIVPYKEFISGQAEPFLSRAGEANCRFIKAGQPQWPFYQSRWQFYQGWPAYGRFINNGRFIKVEDQAAMAALSIRSGKIDRSLRFGLRMADFILSRVRSLSAAKPSHF